MASSQKYGKKGVSSTENDSQNEMSDHVYEPEPKDTEMKIKPFCECQNCRHWSTSVDWCPRPNLEFEDKSNKVHKERKIQPLLRSDKHPGKTPNILSYSSKKLSKTEKQSAFKTMVHGEYIPQPVNLLSETYFHEDIQLILRDLNYNYSLPIQSFVWPAIFRLLNVFMISGKKTGKTMAYLPAMCTFALHKDDKYQEFAKYKGPLIVIVCPNSKQCEHIFDLIKKFYSKIHLKPKVTIVTYPISNMNNMDILITIPNSLIHCIKSRIFNFKRLCHLVFEDTSVLLTRNEENIYNILNVVNEMLEHRLNSTKVQLIISSEQWTNDLGKLLKSLYATPLVCIGNFLEAALYGNVRIENKFVELDRKQIYVEELLRDKYYIYKTLIICDQQELTPLNKWLVRRGIETMALSDNSDKEDIEETEILWNTAHGGQYKVLICTELIFETCLTINDAVWLICYSLPSSWSGFTKIFSAMSAHFRSPLDEEKDKVQCKTFLVIDPTCEDKMPKICSLMSRLWKDYPPVYKRFREDYKNAAENKKLLDQKELCRTVKLFGKCTNLNCNSRHIVSEKQDISLDLPRNGKIVFKILHLKDVTNYVIQLIEHVDTDGNVHKINDSDLKQPLVYDSNTEKNRAKNIEVGKFYVHCDYTTNGEEFMLCRVLTAESHTFVEVKLMTGVTLKTMKKKLYEVPSNLTIVEMYLCNLIPPFNDEYYSGRSYFTTRNSLDSMEYKDIILTGDICLQLDKTFWLKNVVERIKVSHSEVTKFNFTKHLLGLKVVEMCETQLAALYKLCKKCEITLPSYTEPKIKKSVKSKEVEPQRSFLDDNVNEVILSSAVTPEEFYVRLAKYQCLLENLEKDIQNEIKSEILDQNVRVSVGKFYLALDPSGKMYSRVLILNVENEKALCFYPDYGDEAVVDVADVKFLPTKFLTRLPFQAIQCRLHGLSPAFGEWVDEATDTLYKYLLEPDSDIFRSLYVKVCDSEESDGRRAKVRYSVLLKDGFGTRNILINKLLIDCGFATTILSTLGDFELPRQELEEHSVSSDSDRSEDTEDDFEREFEIFNGEEFLELFCPASLLEHVRSSIQSAQLEKQNTNENQTDTNEVNTCQRPATVLPNKPNYFTPDVYWSQNEKHIKMKIKLIGVNDYKVNVVQKRIFTFWTALDGKNYELKFTLCKIAEMIKHCAKGQEVEILLKKIEPVEWLQLTHSKKMRNVHYEISNLEEEKPRRKFLQLDITDEETDNEDNIMFCETSDLDSEFDEEVVSSSD